MSRIEEMIRELCPEGVEYKPLGEIGTFVRGNGLQKKDFADEGVGCIHYGQIYTYYNLFTSQTKSYVDPLLARKLTKVKTGDIIIACTSENMEDVCKAIAWLGEDEIVTGGHACVFSHEQNPKYISYFFNTDIFFQQKKKYARGAKVVDIKVGDIAKIEIPVPPLAIQNEIVNILDKFTELEAKLEAELEARRKQYEYYRNKLLTFNEIPPPSLESVVKWLTMNEICDIRSGKNKIKNGKGLYPVYGSTGIIAYCDKHVYNTQQILIARVGANAGYIHIANGEYDVSDNTLIVGIKNGFNLRYLYYMLVNMNLNQYAKGGGQPLVTAGEIKNLQIPIPPLAEQQRIVAILDKFETLVNDISEGLPAEIVARRQQYEHYRDKLLTFTKATA